MKRNTVRLTESQLHRVIRESVKRVINEIKFGGESLHGWYPNDTTGKAATDFKALEHTRRANTSGDLANLNQTLRDKSLAQSAFDNSDKYKQYKASPKSDFMLWPDEETYQEYEDDWRDVDDNGYDKAQRIINGLKDKKKNEKKHN